MAAEKRREKMRKERREMDAIDNEIIPIYYVNE